MYLDEDAVMVTDWICVPHYYVVRKNYLPIHEVTWEHPLRDNIVTMLDCKVSRTSNSIINNSNTEKSSNVADTFDGSDPLSQFARQEQNIIDPLSQMAVEYESLQNFKISKKRDNFSYTHPSTNDNIINWNTKRIDILNKYTTSEKLSITTSFLKMGSSGGVCSNAIKIQTIVADKIKYRFEQLDDFDDSGDVRQMMDVNQQDYIKRIEQLNQELIESWKNDQRVKSLKIVIQCSKMLADVSVVSFYPSQFVLITDVLDMFGTLVYERLQYKSKSEPDSIRKTDKSSAHATCQNWFCKVGSIKELLPRIYIEISILQCYEFLYGCSYNRVLERLTHMIRGIADPLISTYIRCYLIRKAMPFFTVKDYIYNNLMDIISIYHMIFSNSINCALHHQNIDMSKYLSLYEPPLEFILQSLIYNNNIYTEELLNKVKLLKNNGVILMAMLNVFKPEIVAAYAMDILLILVKSHTNGISQMHLFQILGVKMSQCSSLVGEEGIEFLKLIFQTINEFTDASEYLACVEPWAEFIAKNFPLFEVNSYLNELNIRLSCYNLCTKHCQLLYNIMDKILLEVKNIEMLIAQKNFLPFLDLINNEDIKLQTCKKILQMYQLNSQEQTVDAVLINALMHISKILHDSLTAFTVDDERRHIAQLICNFIHKVHFGRDFERQLSFYIEVRSNFTNLDAVYCTLVHAVNKLSMETYNFVNRKHTRKTKSFVKSCVAFCSITIPSIKSIQQQMDLYKLIGQLALVNDCLGQADACFEAALNLITEYRYNSKDKLENLDSYLIGYLRHLLAILVLVPDSPTKGVLYLFRLLLDVIQTFPFNKNTPGPTIIYMHALDFLYTQSLDEYSYNILNVISNIELYGHDKKFLDEINKLCCYIVNEILQHIKLLGLNQQFKDQAMLSLELLWRIIRYADLNKNEIFNLAIKLWYIAVKNEAYLDNNYLDRTVNILTEIHNDILEYANHNNDKTPAETLEKLLKNLHNTKV